MSAVNDVYPGQVWADADPRSAGRTLRVDRIEGDKAVCTILTNSADVQQQIDAYRGASCPWLQDRRGRSTRISLSRFKPASTGYRLMED